ncbi:MAG: 5'-nucleotidase domain-containing protein [Bacteroidetes bacterium]|nr:5'-nucleotidase domain-containing protein [Bacteroidota bacterium]
MSNKILLILFIPLQLMLCQSVTYELPFSSANNTLELAVENTASLNVVGVRITAQNIPAWLKFTSAEQTIDQLEGKQEKTASFSFSVDKTAPVKTQQTLNFQIKSSDGQTWTKEIRISVNPPDRFELFQNYPNPFNPSTAISYQLSADSRVSLRIYDLLGREVARLVDQDKPAGYHQESWNAVPYSSGMYIYQLTYTDQQGNRQFHRKTMLLVK